MKSLVLVPLLLTTAMEPSQAAVPVPSYLSDPARPKIEEPDILVQRFLEAVDRGELVVFGQTIERSMIVPVRVEYVFDLASRKTLVKVFSNLKAPLQVPGQLECLIRALSAIMVDGRIVEIESHIWMKE